MVQRTLTTLVDDFDNTQEAEVTRVLNLDGKTVRLDLTAANSARLDAAVAEFLAAGSPVRSTKVTSGQRAGRRDPADRLRIAEIRDWARSNGHTVADRGRLPAEVIAAYEARNGH